MPCPGCGATVTIEQPRRTALGYRTFRCGTCQRTFNERTGTPFNHLHYPTDLVVLVVLWRLRYKLSLRDLAEMFLPRGVVFTHAAVRDWEARFAPLHCRLAASVTRTSNPRSSAASVAASGRAGATFPRAGDLMPRRDSDGADANLRPPRPTPQRRLPDTAD